ncbi:hypothetical protein [Lichenicola cladoniae]|nr:hypothetical protein [Lichenicola cladoniae]
MKRMILFWLCLACTSTALIGCAATPQQRGPFHEYLHDHALE